MKITKSQLRSLIRNELARQLNEQGVTPARRKPASQQAAAQKPAELPAEISSEITDRISRHNLNKDNVPIKGRIAFTFVVGEGDQVSNLEFADRANESMRDSIEAIVERSVRLKNLSGPYAYMVVVN